MERLPPDPVRRGRPAAGRGDVLRGAGRRVVLWRHGRTRWNADGRFQGQLDSPLEPAGLVDVALAAQVLAQLPPSRLLTSSAGRARRSAAYLERECGLRADVEPRLREIHLGDWQGLTRDDARVRFPDQYDAWVRGDDVRRGGGETYSEVGERAAAALLAALDGVPAGGVLVAVTHGGTARAAIGHLLGLPRESWGRFAPLGNARWSVLLESDRGFRLAEHNAGVTEPVDRSRIAAPDVEPDAEGVAASADI